jgi:hypothetical protein
VWGGEEQHYISARPIGIAPYSAFIVEECVETRNYLSPENERARQGRATAGAAANK